MDNLSACSGSKSSLERSRKHRCPCSWDRPVFTQDSCLATPGKASEELFKAVLIKTNTPPHPTSCPLQKTNYSIALFTEHKGILYLRVFFFVFSFSTLAPFTKERMAFKLGYLKHKHLRIQMLPTFPIHTAFIWKPPFLQFYWNYACWGERVSLTTF